ncbi:DUF4424 family protein [Falsiruegeria mediterranea]|nr:DUF4424 family protein [Falsiruegeria mediterranea]
MAAATLSMVVPMPLYANDSMAVMEAGGLRLVRDAPVEILTEQLYISTTEIRVDYQFRAADNLGTTTLVAFPLPEYDLAWHSYSVLGEDSDTVQSRSNFRVWVDGNEISPQLEVKAMRNGIDVTSQLISYGIPIDSLSYLGLMNALEAQSSQARSWLQENDVVRWNDGYDPEPLWTAKATYYWSQTFPAGKTVHVRHAYRPIAGAFFIADPQLRDFSPADFCMSAGEKKGVLNRLKKANHGALLASQVRYVLTTGANWQGPIGQFHLIVDKARPEALVSLCFDGLKKTAPTRFETTIRNFVPTQDLDLLFVNSDTP